MEVILVDGIQFAFRYFQMCLFTCSLLLLTVPELREQFESMCQNAEAEQRNKRMRKKQKVVHIKIEQMRCLSRRGSLTFWQLVV